jgi:non-lysosomal glucosylceramidase
MADTTTLWITELYEFYANTGDAALVVEFWPTAKRAINWQIAACNGIDLPWRLVCTYDILVLEKYNTTTYNSFLHMLAMAAGGELARVVGDAATAAAADAALARAQAALPALLWNSTYSYFRAYTGGDAVMTDALYGQEIALHHGLGWLYDKSAMSSHLAAELKYNSCPYGLTTITGRHEPPPLPSKVSKRHAAALESLARAGVDTQDDTIWLQSAPTWSVMQLRLQKAAGAAFAPLSAAAVTAALEPARWQLENVRTRLHDLWNFAGLNSGGDWGSEAVNGMPWITSHYGFSLVDYYLYSALTGQQLSIPEGRLSFDPVYPCPYTLPFLAQGREGTLVCTGGNSYTLKMLFGSLRLPPGGLSVSGKAYAGSVDLDKGESVSW